MVGNLLAEFESNIKIKLYIQSKAKRYLAAVDKKSRPLIQAQLLQTPWTAFFGAVAILEGLVLAWGAQRFYKVWSRLYAYVTAIRLPWQAKAEVEDEVEVQPKQVRHRQAAIDARNE